MADLVPATQTGSMLAPLTDPMGGSLPARLGAFASQPAVRRTLPWFGGVTAAGLTALLWLNMAPAPQRVLYSQPFGFRARASGRLAGKGQYPL